LLLLDFRQQSHLQSGEPTVFRFSIDPALFGGEMETAGWDALQNKT
jgi:hypothetical protein